MDMLLKSGIFGLLVVLSFPVIFVVGLILVAIIRSKRAATVFALLAFLPLLLGLCGTALGYRQISAAVAAGQISPEAANHPQGIVAVGRHEARYSTYLGLAASAILLAFAGCGVAITRSSNKPVLTDGYSPPQT
ncbi:MAG: hypothetical protein RRC34_16355 [Lentisphaeria bacterium]|nr:hypothetical protein [Lentisphaeria bacterium]